MARVKSILIPLFLVFGKHAFATTAAVTSIALTTSYEDAYTACLSNGGSEADCTTAEYTNCVNQCVNEGTSTKNQCNTQCASLTPAPTTIAVTTVPVTTSIPTTQAQTTQAATTQAATTQASTTKAATTKLSTTQSTSTKALTTEASTTQGTTTTLSLYQQCVNDCLADPNKKPGTNCLDACKDQSTTTLRPTRFSTTTAAKTKPTTTTEADVNPKLQACVKVCLHFHSGDGENCLDDCNKATTPLVPIIPTSLSPYQACYIDCLDTQTGVNCQTYCENHPDTTAAPKTTTITTTDSPEQNNFVEDLFVLLLILFVFEEIVDHNSEASSSFQFGSNLLLIMFLTMMARRFMN